MSEPRDMDDLLALYRELQASERMCGELVRQVADLQAQVADLRDRLAFVVGTTGQPEPTHMFGVPRAAVLKILQEHLPEYFQRIVPMRDANGNQIGTFNLTTGEGKLWPPT